MNPSLQFPHDADSIPVGMLRLLLPALGPDATGHVLARWMLSLGSSDRERVLAAYHDVFDGTGTGEAG